LRLPRKKPVKKGEPHHGDGEPEDDRQHALRDPVDVLPPARMADVRVDLGRVQAHVPEELLEDADVAGVVVEERRRERVTELVRRDAFRDAGALRHGNHEVVHRAGAEPPTSAGEEHSRVAVVARRQIALEFRSSPSVERDLPILIPLAVAHPEQQLVEIDVGSVEADELRDAQARVDADGDDRDIALRAVRDATRRCRASGFEHEVSLPLREVDRQPSSAWSHTLNASRPVTSAESREMRICGG
jgi:hypothetical protein